MAKILRNKYKMELLVTVPAGFQTPEYILSTNDISDFVFSCDAIPINYERNVNWMPIISEFNMKISQKLSIIPKKNDYIVFYVNNEVKQVGVIEDIKFVYETHSFDVNVRSVLKKLQDRKLKYEFDLTYRVGDNGGDQRKFNSYDNDSNENYGIVTANVSITWFLKAMFGVVGLTLDTDSVENVIIVKSRTRNRDAAPIQYAVNEICLDYNSIFSVNQDGALHPIATTTNTDCIKNFITYWDYISVICGFIGFVIVPTNYNAYKLVHKSQLAEVNINSIKKYKYSNDNKVALYDTTKAEFYMAWRSEYSKASSSEVKALHIPDKPSETMQKMYANYTNVYTPHWYNNILFLFRLKNYTTGQIGYIDQSLGVFSAYYNDGMQNYDFTIGPLYPEVEDKVETDTITGNFNLLQNKINFSNERSIITKNKILL